MHLYDKPVANAEIQGLTLAEDDQHLYDAVPMLLNWRLLVTPKATPGMWTYGWCYDGRTPIAAALKVWDPQTQNEPLGWKKRPATMAIRVAPRMAEGDPHYNRPRCEHGGYPDDGPCATDPFCKGARPLPSPAEAAVAHEMLKAQLAWINKALREA